MSAIFSDPPIFGGLCNPDIQANKFTPLDLKQGGSSPPSPPSAPPGNLPLLTLDINDPTGIQVSLDTTNITGTAPISYTCSFEKADGTGSSKQAMPYSFGLIYIFSTTNNGDLENDTPYNFQVTATNAYGSVVGGIQEFSTTSLGILPGNLPALEQSIGIYPNTITLYFYTGDVTGSIPITYTCNFGQPIEGLIHNAPITMSKPGDYELQIRGLLANMPCLFQLTATNSAGSTLGIIQTFQVDTT